MATMTQEQFEAAFRIRQEKVVYDSDLRALEAEYGAKKRFMEQRLAKIQATCPHPFTKRSTAESDTVCEVCGSFDA